MLTLVERRSEPSLKDLLDAFCGSEEAKSAQAFEDICVLTRRGLNAYLREKLYSEEAREDVIQEVLRRLWSNRAQLENRGTSAWWSLVKRIADQCRVDFVRKVGAEVSWDDEEIGEVPYNETSAVDALLEQIDERDGFYRAADELWLGFAPVLDDRERSRRVLAAQLFFCERMSWEEVCALLSRGDGEKPLTRAQLDIWLGTPSTIRSLAFRSLYRDNDRLTIHLLGLDGLFDRALNQISSLAMSGDESHLAPSAWTWPEVRAIIWRYRDAERQDRILAEELCSLDKAELVALFDRCLDLFPFPRIMKQLAEDLAQWPKARQELADPGLWQRLVLEYYCRDTTHHRDIYERTVPAADIATFHLTMGMLNVWLSNGRLFAKLASYIQTQGTTS